MITYEELERIRSRTLTRRARWFGISPVEDVLRLLEEIGVFNKELVYGALQELIHEGTFDE